MSRKYISGLSVAKLSEYGRVALLVLFFQMLGFAQTSAPKITDWVTDQTGTLSDQEKSILGKRLKSFNDTTSNQVIILMVASLEGKPIEDYALEIGRNNLVGTKDKNNGIVFLIVKNEKKMRIEVGRGLEGALPDITAGSIIRNEVSPFFKQQRYFDGIASGLDAIIKATAGEYHVKAEKNKGKKPFSGIGAIIFIVIFVLFVLPRRLGFMPLFFGGFGGFGGGRGFGGGGSDGGGFGGFSGGGGGFGGGGASGDCRVIVIVILVIAMDLLLLPSCA